MPGEKLDFGVMRDSVRDKSAHATERFLARPFPFNPAFADIYVGERDGPGKPASEAIRPSSASDPVRDVFMQMRRLAGPALEGAPSGNAFRERIFYAQARFMEGFEDAYPKAAPFSMYYPYYQMMSYEQLRTYFTWRSRVRAGSVARIDLSYVFLYIYELINNIGAEPGEDGLRKLLHIWKECRAFAGELDAYMPVWLKDYIVINDCGVSFEGLLEREPLLRSFYPDGAGKYGFDFYCGISPYKIKRSPFYTEETESLIAGCFGHVLRRLDRLLGAANASFNDLILMEVEMPWRPFANAIFLMRPEYTPREEKTVTIPGGLKYRYRGGRWTYAKYRGPSPEGRQILSCFFKRIELMLCADAGFRRRLSADGGPIIPLIDRLAPSVGGAALLAEIDRAVKEYCFEKKKTSINVDEAKLELIRQRALLTQERLAASVEAEPQAAEADGKAAAAKSGPPAAVPALDPAAFIAVLPFPDPPSSPESGGKPRDAWAGFIRSLEPAELKALKLILEGAPASAVLECARECGLMPEVLMDSINQKALEHAGDTILDVSDEIYIYEDYLDHLRRAAESDRH